MGAVPQVHRSGTSILSRSSSATLQGDEPFEPAVGSQDPATLSDILHDALSLRALRDAGGLSTLTPRRGHRRTGHQTWQPNRQTARPSGQRRLLKHLGNERAALFTFLPPRCGCHQLTIRTGRKARCRLPARLRRHRHRHDDLLTALTSGHHHPNTRHAPHREERPVGAERRRPTLGEHRRLDATTQVLRHADDRKSAVRHRSCSIDPEQQAILVCRVCHTITGPATMTLLTRPNAKDDHDL